MQEEVQLNLEDTREKMQNALDHLETELVKIRAGKASTHILDGINVDYYGTNTPLNQVANINTPDAKTVSVQPWEKSMIELIEKAILQANIGITPINNGEIIRLNIPPLTEERRKELSKQVKAMGEEAKVSVRNARRDAKDEIKKMQKDGLSEDLAKDAEVDIQEITDMHVKKVDNLIENKERDIMTI